jgi:TatD DNase family protein
MFRDETVGPVDFHCHLDLHPDMRQAYDRCERTGCLTLAVTTTPKAFARNRSMAARTRFVHAALGLHPQLVSERAAEVAMFEELIGSTRFVGEIGLDAGRRFYPSFDRQREVFERIMTLCGRLGEKVISLHSVRTAKHVLDTIERTDVHHTCDPVLHWFNASRSEIGRAVELGCFFSVNEQMLSTPRGRDLLAIVPIQRLLTETDAPFQTTNDVAKSPGDVAGTIALIAAAFRTDETSVRGQIRETARALVEP